MSRRRIANLVLSQSNVEVVEVSECAMFIIQTQVWGLRPLLRRSFPHVFLHLSFPSPFLPTLH